jgi:transposase-like protein
MAKIPQGEWSAIAERYSQGESISSIARRYGCTAPAIHYILKRNTESTAVPNHRPGLAPASTKAEVVQPARIGGGENGRSSSALTARRALTVQATPPPPKGQYEQKSNRDFAPFMDPARTERSPAAPLQPERGEPRRVSRASALKAGLDAELHAEAEAAIHAFRSSFEAALAENVPAMRARLRQTASDLMRVAARTTIVLDRLNAGVRTAARGD